MKKLALAAIVLLCVFVSGSTSVSAQERSEYSRVNTFEVFASGAYTSSHILLGATRNRQIAGIGFGYARRLLHSNAVDVSYLAELRPVLFISDPFVHVRERITYPTFGESFIEDYTYRQTSKCIPGSGSYIGGISGYNGIGTEYSVDYAVGCGRERTFAQAFSPLGFKLATRTRHRVQPTLAGTLGYLYSNQPVPLDDSGSFNFVFDFGPGIEFYRDKGRSVALEYRLHHISNKNTAAENPGTDMMLMKVSYNFGR